jgi:hypothetical protein
MKYSFVGNYIAMRLLARSKREWKNKNRLDLVATGAITRGGRPLKDRDQWPISVIEAVQLSCNMRFEKIP